MNTLYPVFINGTKIIPQPNCCFVYSKRQQIFDIFNFESLIFFSEMHGAASTQQIIDNVAVNYPTASLEVIENDLLKLQKFLKERGYLATYINPIDNSTIFEYADRMSEVKIVQADIEITKNCNLRCKYCFNESGNGNPELPLNQWIELLDSLYSRGLRIIKISGGEPFLYPGILELLEYAQEKFIVSVNTSGYFIDEEIASKLSAMNLQIVQISLDSKTAKVHDSLRGKGTWEKAVRAIELLHRANIPIRISMTVTAHNYDEIGDIKSFANEYGAELSLEVLNNVGNARKMESAYFLTTTEKVNQYSSKSTAHKILDELKMTCQSQIGIVGISHKGNIKPCNLTEEFFAGQNADVVMKFEKNWRYSDSPILANANSASDKVISLLKDGTIKSKDKCIFEY